MPVQDAHRHSICCMLCEFVSRFSACCLSHKQESEARCEKTTCVCVCVCVCRYVCVTCNDVSGVKDFAREHVDELLDVHTTTRLHHIALALCITHQQTNMGGGVMEGVSAFLTFRCPLHSSRRMYQQAEVEAADLCSMCVL